MNTDKKNYTLLIQQNRIIADVDTLSSSNYFHLTVELLHNSTVVINSTRTRQLFKNKHQFKAQMNKYFLVAQTVLFVQFDGH